MDDDEFEEPRLQLEFIARIKAYCEELCNTIFSEKTLNAHCIICWMIILIEMMLTTKDKEQNLLLLFTICTAVAILFAMIGISGHKSLSLIPLLIVSIINGVRFFFYVIVIFHQLQVDAFEKKILPLDVEPKWEKALLLGYAIIGSYYFFVALTIAMIFVVFQDEEGRQIERDLNMADMALVVPNLHIIRTGPEFIEVNSDSPPNYSVVIREAPELVHTAKEETSPPRYSQLNSNRV